MARFLLIETQSAVAARLPGDAAALRAGGNDVVLVLAQDGVTVAVGPAAAVRGLADLGVPVLVDDFSLAVRGLRVEDVAAGTRACPIDAVTDLLLRPGTRVVWH